MAEAAVLAAVPAEERILDGLSDAQREAVLHGDGPLLIIAGAGTGKTTVLTRRIAHLIATQARAARGDPGPHLHREGRRRDGGARGPAHPLRLRRDLDLAPSTPSATTCCARRRSKRGSNPEFRVLTRPEQIIFLRERLLRLPLERFRPLGDPTQHLSRPADPREPRQGRGRLARCSIGPGPRHRRPPRRRRGRAGRSRVATSSSRPSTRRTRGCWRKPALVDFGDQIHRTLALLRERPALLAQAARALPLRAGRRVPGHEPRAARDAAPAGRRRGAQHHRRGRRRPGDLPLARRGRREPAGLPRLYPGRPRGGADARTTARPSSILDAAARLIALQQPLPARGRWRGSTSACARRGAGGAAGPPPPLRHGLRRGRRRGGADRGAAARRASGRATSRSSCAATPTPTPSCAP